MTKTLQPVLKEAIEKVVASGASLSEILAAIAPAPEKVPAPSVTPLPAKLTDEQEAALNKVREVFGKVVPQERRTLEPDETVALLDERDTLDRIEKMAKSRKEDIRTTVFHHLDVLVEEAGLADEAETDKDGHYIIEGEVIVEDAPTKFVRQISNRSPGLSEPNLRALVEDDEIEFSHEDYLAMTSPVRVIDENKVMLLLKKRPELLSAVAKATTPGGKIASMYQRKR